MSAIWRKQFCFVIMVVNKRFKSSLTQHQIQLSFFFFFFPDVVYGSKQAESKKGDRLKKCSDCKVQRLWCLKWNKLLDENK